MTATFQPLIKIEDGHKAWYAGNRRIEILRGINLSVHAGESLAIMGPSGAGKSTLLHVLGLLTPLDEGSFWFDGKRIEKENKKWDFNLRRQIGFIFQDAKLIPDLNVMENVCVPLMHRGVWPTHQEHCALEALSQVGLIERVRHKPSELSGGELMRTAIARAVVQNPRVLLIDEPTGNLDSITGKEISTLLLNMVTPERAVVFVTHHQPLADCSDRTLTMKDGILEPREGIGIHELTGGKHG